MGKGLLWTLLQKRYFTDLLCSAVCQAALWKLAMSVISFPFVPPSHTILSSGLDTVAPKDMAKNLAG